LSKRNAAETGIRYEWYALQRWGSEYWREFSDAKVFVPAIEDEANYAPDFSGFFGNDKTSFFIPPSVPFALAVTNSPISWWITRQTFPSKQGGFYEFKPMYISALPIPIADSSQQSLCERLAEALICLHRPSPKSARDSDTNLIIGYFEQWLNGLIYELFFRDELHARKLKLFDETAKLNPPKLAKLSEVDKMAHLRELFERAYDPSAALRGSLFDLRSLESVRIIEEETGENPSSAINEVE